MFTMKESTRYDMHLCCVKSKIILWTIVLWTKITATKVELMGLGADSSERFLAPWREQCRRPSTGVLPLRPIGRRPLPKKKVPGDKKMGQKLLATRWPSVITVTTLCITVIYIPAYAYAFLVLSNMVKNPLLSAYISII